MLVIKKEADIISVIAFAVSLVALVPQVYFFVRGPSPSIVQPSAVVLHEEIGLSGMPHLALTAPMVYLNNGSPNSSLVVLQQFVELNAGAQSFELRASHVVETNSVGADYDNMPRSSALPFSVSEGEGYAEQVKFRPRPPVCQGAEMCDQRANVRTIEEVLGSTEMFGAVNISFVTVTSHGNISTTCEFELSPGIRIALIEYRWVAVDCQ